MKITNPTTRAKLVRFSGYDRTVAPGETITDEGAVHDDYKAKLEDAGLVFDAPEKKAPAKDEAKPKASAAPVKAKDAKDG